MQDGWNYREVIEKQQEKDREFERIEAEKAMAKQTAEIGPQPPPPDDDDDEEEEPRPE
jgi:hypothetical protein